MVVARDDHDDDEEEEEYLSSLAEVEAATARLEAAKRKLALKQRSAESSARTSKPLGARTRVERSDAGSLLVKVPPAGFTSNTMMGGAFSAAWFSAIGPATVSMIAGGAALTSGLFMLPFWLAGGMVAKQTILDPAKATSLSIGEFAWELKQTVAGATISQEGGPSEELVGADVAVAAYVNDIPTYALRLGATGGRVWTLGSDLDVSELEWLAEEINGQIEGREGSSALPDGDWWNYP